MRRIRLLLEYDGTNYSGWQRQENAPSVQQTLEAALRRLTGEADLFVVGASRTDAGVHAMAQNAHFDTACRIPAEKFSFALASMLPEDIRAVQSTRVSEAFHARFSAKKKEYRYVIHNAPHASALYRNLSAHISYPLNETRMQDEARLLVGTRDFAPFAASGSEAKDTVRTIYESSVARAGQEIEIRVTGNGFLYNMVRIFAGTLIGVGAGKLEPGAISKALASGSRLDLGVTAPARGLTLMRVDYGDEANAIEEEVRR